MLLSCAEEGIPVSFSEEAGWIGVSADPTLRFLPGHQPCWDCPSLRQVEAWFALRPVRVTQDMEELTDQGWTYPKQGSSSPSVLWTSRSLSDADWTPGREGRDEEFTQWPNERGALFMFGGGVHGLDD